jgi:hypothetical protein
MHSLPILLVLRREFRISAGHFFGGQANRSLASAQSFEEGEDRRGLFAAGLGVGE